MTKEQQKIIDGFHEKIIALIFKRRRAQRYSSWTEEESINREIFKIEDERRAYEGDCKQSRSKERQIAGGISEVKAGAVNEETEAGVQPD